MRRIVYLVALLVLCVGLSVPSAQAGKPVPGPAAVPLVVSIHDGDFNTASAYNIRNVGGDYVNGVDGVAASFETDGNFVIRATGTRQFYYEYDEPLAGNLPDGYGVPADPATGQYPPEALATPQHGAYTSGNQFITLRTGTVALQSMDENSSQCLRIAAVYDVGTAVRYRQTFQRTASNGIDPFVDNTAWGIITRTGPNTWTVESGVGACTSGLVLDAPGAARIVRTETLSRNRTLVTNHGRFNLSFKMTLTRG